MVRSMTGYGRAETRGGEYRVVCEIRSVNHRFFEFSARVPRSCGFLEEKLKSFLGKLVSRGKVECNVQLESLLEQDLAVRLNPSLLRGYLEAFAKMEQDFGLRNDIAVSSLMRVPELFTVEKREVDEDAVWEAVRPAAQEAAERFIAMREAEGSRLQDDILGYAKEILGHVAFVEERSPQTVREYNEKLAQRMRDLLAEASVEEQRLLTEAAIFADKTAVAEETVRLRSHMAQMEGFFGGSEPIGRKLDFLVQEMNREANTIGSKAQDIAIARHVVEIKALVEKIKEQVQNLE